MRGERQKSIGMVEAKHRTAKHACYACVCVSQLTPRPCPWYVSLTSRSSSLTSEPSLRSDPPLSLAAALSALRVL